MADAQKYTIKADFPNMAKGKDAPEFEVTGIGIMQNGESKKLELTREQAEFLASAHGIEVSTEGGKEVKGKPFVPEDDAEVPAPEPEEPPEVEIGTSVTEVSP